MKNILNKPIYIAPYNDISIQVQEYLNKYYKDMIFCEFLDKSRREVQIEEKNPTIIIASPNYYKEISNNLTIKYHAAHIEFIYAIILDKHKIYFTDSSYIYSLYCILLKLLIFTKSLLNTFKKYLNKSKKYLYQNNYFLPKFILKYQGRKELKKEKASVEKEAIEDEWLKKNKNSHKGKRCFILATGPSLNKINLEKIKDEFTIGVNGIYKIAQEINLDHYIYVSNWYWKHHVEGIQNVPCKRRFLPLELRTELDSKIDTSWINILRPKYYSKLGYPLTVPSSFSKKPQKFFSAGGSVVYLALQLAYHLGFNEIIILGLDHNYKKDDYNSKKHGGYVYDAAQGDKAHFDKNYIPVGTKYHVDLDAMENGYKIAKKIFENDNRRILNASPDTKLNIFEKIEYDRLF